MILQKSISAPHLACSRIPAASLVKIMLDEKVEKERCIWLMKVAYALGLYGNRPSVLVGSAGAMFHLRMIGLAAAKRSSGKDAWTKKGTTIPKGTRNGLPEDGPDVSMKH